MRIAAGFTLTDHATRRQHDIERAKLAVIDWHVERRCQALEGDLATQSVPQSRRSL